MQPCDTAATRELLSKGQNIRLMDVFLLGPVMMYFGMADTKIHPALRLAMGLSGVGTIVYNAHNYLAVQREIERRDAAGTLECRLR